MSSSNSPTYLICSKSPDYHVVYSQNYDWVAVFSTREEAEKWCVDFKKATFQTVLINH